MQPNWRLDFDPPGRDGRLLVAFEKVPKGELRDFIRTGVHPAIGAWSWYGRKPLAFFYTHDKLVRPNGRFDHALSGVAGQAPDATEVAAFLDHIHEWLGRVDQEVPIVAAWGWSGRLKKAKPADPVFARAWVEAIEGLGRARDGVIGRWPDKLLLRAAAELEGADRDVADAVVAARREVWKGTL